MPPLCEKMNLTDQLKTVFGTLQAYMLSPSTDDAKGLGAQEFVEHLLVNLAHLYTKNGKKDAAVFMLKLIPHCTDFPKLLEILEKEKE